MLKGCGGGYGYPQLTEIARDIENLLKKSDYPSLDQAVNDLQRTCDRIYLGMPQQRESA